jgi:hypothetical protein
MYSLEFIVSGLRFERELLSEREALWLRHVTIEYGDPTTWLQVGGRSDEDLTCIELVLP